MALENPGDFSIFKQSAYIEYPGITKIMEEFGKIVIISDQFVNLHFLVEEKRIDKRKSNPQEQCGGNRTFFRP